MRSRLESSAGSSRFSFGGGMVSPAAALSIALSNAASSSAFFTADSSTGKVASIVRSSSIGLLLSDVARGVSPGPTSLLCEPHGECCAAIEATRLFARVVVPRPLFAVAHRLQAIGAHTVRGQVFAYGGGAAFAEREVVFGRADVAGVAFERQPQRGVFLHRRHGLLEQAHRFGPQRVTVEVEVHVFEREHLLLALDHLDGYGV